MPTPILEDYKDEYRNERRRLGSAIQGMLREVRQPFRFKVDYNTLVSTEWSGEQRALVDELVKLIGGEQLVSGGRHNATAVIRVEHPVLLEPRTFVPMFAVNTPNSFPPKLFPKSWVGRDVMPFSNAVVEILGETLKEIVNYAIDYFCLKHTLNTLRWADTYEVALYMFPHFKQVMDMAGIEKDISIRKPPEKLIRLSEQHRRMMRHAHTLMAQHMLLGTWEAGYKRPMADKDNCTVTMAGNLEWEFETDAGVRWKFDFED